MEKLTPATMTAAVNGRSVVYAPEIQDLLAREAKVFRVNAALVGVSDFHLISAAVAARPVLPSERSVFKPAAGADINHDSATRTIRALGQDVMTGIQTPPPPAHRLCGAWPYAATSYLREWLFSSDPLPVSLLSKRGVTRFDTLTRIVDRAVASWPGADAEGKGSALAGQIQGASSTHDRRQAVALFRRASATLADGVAALTANALWLMNSADREKEPQADLVAVLWETLRLLPPAWLLLRNGGDEYTVLHPSIRPGDKIALFPLLMHRDPEYWSAPLEFRPERWAAVADPENTPAFMPFGFDGARCWAKHLVIPLAERLLGIALENQLTIPGTQQETRIPLRPLLSVRFRAKLESR
jgi:Cytochrome P450